MGYSLTNINVEDKDSLVGQTTQLNPAYLNSAFYLAQSTQRFKMERTSQPVKFDGLSLTDIFTITKHYQLGTYLSTNHSSSIGGAGLFLIDQHFETLPNASKDEPVIDIERVEVKTKNGDQHILPRSAISIIEAPTSSQP